MIYLVAKRMGIKEELTYEVVTDPKVYYIGPILTPGQIQALKERGNTVIPYSVYKRIDENILLEEIKKLVGFNCVIFVYNHEEERLGVRSSGTSYTVVVEKVGTRRC